MWTGMRKSLEQWELAVALDLGGAAVGEGAEEIELRRSGIETIRSGNGGVRVFDCDTIEDLVAGERK